MEITQPRRILIISPPSTSLSLVINTLVPVPATEPPQHEKDEVEPVHHIRNQYFTAKVPIWTDTIDDIEAWSKEWKEQDGAAEVVRAVGGWIVTFAKPVTRDDMESIKNILKSVSSVIKYHDSDPYSLPSSDIIQLAISLPQAVSPALNITDVEWEDICRDYGNWEYIDATASGQVNSYGGRYQTEKTGLPRLLESLHSGSWELEATGVDSDAEIDDILNSVDADLEKPFDPAEVAAEDSAREPILGLLDDDSGANKKAREAENADEDSDVDVEKLQKMLGRMQAAKEAGSELGEAERKRLAREAVKAVMKEL